MDGLEIWSVMDLVGIYNTRPGKCIGENRLFTDVKSADEPLALDPFLFINSPNTLKTRCKSLWIY